MKHPMFAETTEDMEGHPLVEAIRALKEDDKSPYELALMYKDEGNEWLKKNTIKYIQEAYKRYTIALQHLEKLEPHISGQRCFARRSDEEQLKSQLYSNRAFASLKMRNYGECVKDADSVFCFHC